MSEAGEQVGRTSCQSHRPAESGVSTMRRVSVETSILEEQLPPHTALVEAVPW